MKFEEAIEKLNGIKDRLESEDITLDESVKLFSESVEYTKLCLDTLKETEGKITVIKNELGNLVEKPLDSEE